MTLVKHQKTHTNGKMETNLHYQHLYSEIHENFCFCIVMIYTHIKRREPDIVALAFVMVLVFVSFNTNTNGRLVFQYNIFFLFVSMDGT